MESNLFKIICYYTQKWTPRCLFYGYWVELPLWLRSPFLKWYWKPESQLWNEELPPHCREAGGRVFWRGHLPTTKFFPKRKRQVSVINTKFRFLLALCLEMQMSTWLISIPLNYTVLSSLLLPVLLLPIWKSKKCTRNSPSTYFIYWLALKDTGGRNECMEMGILQAHIAWLPYFWDDVIAVTYLK